MSIVIRIGFAIYVLHELGVYLDKEIGKVFALDIRRVPGAVKRGQNYLIFLE
jgi:hypothetical protein